MKRVLTLLLTALLAACGSGDSNGSGDSAPAPVMKRAFTDDDIERMRTQDWEWFIESAETLPEAVGRILTPAGEPVAGATATVVVKPPIPTILPRRLQTVTADERGVFRLENIPTNVWVFAEEPELAGRLVDATALFFAGEDEPTIELRSAAAISGQVTDPDRAPLPGATVLATTALPDWFQPVVTDGAGRYRVEGAPLGMVDVAVLPGKYIGERRTIELPPGEVTDVNLSAVAIPPVVGALVDEITGAPVRNAIVSGVLDREFIVRADDQGVCRIEGAVQPMLFARAWGYAQVPVRLITGRETEQSVRVPMTRGAVVQGRVTDDAGNPLAGVRVKAIVGGQGGQGQVVFGPLTAEDGTYDFSWMPVAIEGTDVLLVGNKPGWLSGYLSRFMAKKGEFITGKDIEMVRPATFRGRLVDEAGQPLPYARFRSLWAGQAPDEVLQFVLNATTGKSRGDGSFELRGLRAGTSTLWVRADGYSTWETTVTVEEGEVLQDQVLVRPAGLPIGGKLVGVGEVRPERAIVELSSPALRGPESIPVQADGSFRIEGWRRGSTSSRSSCPATSPGESRSAPEPRTWSSSSGR